MQPTSGGNPAYERACGQIDFWYRKGERTIALSPQTFADYRSGLQFMTRSVDGPVSALVPKRRLAYKTAIVYVADGWY